MYVIGIKRGDYCLCGRVCFEVAVNHCSHTHAIKRNMTLVIYANYYYPENLFVK